MGGLLLKECQSQAGLSKLLDFLLEPLQKFRCRDAVHLGVVVACDNQEAGYKGMNLCIIQI